jgi:hypothetical protein
MTSDRPIAYAVLAAYVALVVWLVPPDGQPLMLIGVSVLTAGVVIADRLWGLRATNSLTILVVSFIGVAVLVFPNFPAMGGTSPAAVSLGFLGSQGLALLWLALRWTPSPPRRTRGSLPESLTFGVLAALVLSALATLPIVIATFAEPSEVVGILWVYPAYFAGATAASLLYWLLQGALHRPVGRYLIGALAGMCLYGAVAPVVSMVEGEPLVITEMIAIATVAGVLVGPPVAMGLIGEG